MAFSRKHYQAIASILADELSVASSQNDVNVEEAIASIARQQAEFFKSDNPEFSYVRFYHAIGLDEFGEVE